MITVNIAGSTMEILAGTLYINDTIGERSIANFTVLDRNGALKYPSMYPQGTRVEILDNGERIFSGVLDKVKSSVLSPDGSLQHSIECVDNHYFADKRIIAKSYTMMSAGAIVRDIVDEILFQEGVAYTQASIEDGPTITGAVFRDITCSDALSQLADRCGYWWTIDADKVLWFKPLAFIMAPRTFDGTEPGCHDTTVQYGNPEYRNREILLGVRDETPLRSESFVGDGMTRSWTLGFPLAHEPVIEVNNNLSTLSNPGFEEGLNDWFIFSSAPGVPGNDRYEIVTTEKRSGSKSLHIVKSDYTSGAVGVYHTPIPVPPGETLQASAYIKGTGTDVRIQLEYKNYLDTLAWQDTFDTDQLAAQYTSGGDTPATWTVSNGVLTGTGGTQATLLKKNTILQNCKIVVNSDRADDGGIIARYQDNNNYYLLALCDDSAPYENLRLYRRVNGAYTKLASANITWPRGTAKQIIFTLYGSSLEVYFDGVKVISATDTTYTSGMVGLRDHDNTFRVLDWAVYYAQQGMMVEEGTNLLTANQSDVETDLSGLYGWGSVTLSRDTTTAWHGTASAKATASANSTQSSIHTDRVPVTAGSVYSASVYAKTSVPRDGNLTIWWYDANNTMITNSNVSFSITTAWQRFVVTGTAPSNATSCHVELYCYNLVAGDSLWWDGAQLEAKAVTTSQTFSFKPTSDWQYVSISGTAPANTMSAWLNIYSYGNCDIYVDDCELKRIYSVGIKGIETGKDFYWSKGDPVIYHDQNKPVLTASDTMKIEYIGMYPVKIITANDAEISRIASLEGGSGIVENVDRTGGLETADAGLQYASQLLDYYSRDATRINFTTRQSGYAAGQLLHVNLSHLGLSGDFFIDSVDVHDTDGIVYTVSCVQGPLGTGWAKLFKRLSEQGSIRLDTGESGEIIINPVSLEDIAIAYESVTVDVLACPLCGPNTYVGPGLIVC